MALRRDDIIKLVLDNYTVLRRDYKNNRILIAGLDGCWLTYEKGFESDLQIDARMIQLLKHNDVIEDQ